MNKFEKKMKLQQVNENRDRKRIEELEERLDEREDKQDDSDELRDQIQAMREYLEDKLPLQPRGVS